ncbi:MAG: hypothetical protein M1839_003592 [Geoglossum umbratile]|nr:MAG: hypothetical protein M1839_003592 [Geoglossum umbratile]
MPYYGIHTSLYRTLPPDAIPILEDAIFKTRIGLYEAAEVVFKKKLSTHSHVPIVAIEHAELLLHQWKCREILDVLGKVPAASLSCDEDVRQLVAIFRAVAEMKYEAVYEPALKEIENMQEWKSKSVENYTDIQVECIRKYVLACIVLGSQSDFIVDDMKLLPTPKPSPTSPSMWQGLTDLRVSLISQGRYTEALRFSTVERAVGSAVESYQTAILLLGFVTSHLASVSGRKDDELFWRTSMLELKVSLGKLFASIGEAEKAEIWLSSWEQDLALIIELASGNSGALKVSDCAGMLGVEYYRLKAHEADPTELRFQQALDLGERMLAKSHIETQECHYLSLAWAKKLYDGDKHKLEVVSFDIQMRTQYLFERIQGRTSEAAVNLAADILGPRVTQIHEVARSIEMLDSFINSHPHITLPSTRSVLQSVRSLLYTQAGREDFDVFGVFDNSNVPHRFNIRRAGPNPIVDDQVGEIAHVLEKRGVDDREFDSVVGFFSQGTPQEVLRRLFSEDSASGILDAKAIDLLFKLDGSSAGDLREELSLLDGKALMENLVGTESSLVSRTEWITRCKVLRIWLLDQSRPDLLLREFLWVTLHNARLAAWNAAFQNNTTSGRGPGLVIELIEVIEERLALEEGNKGYSYNHFEREGRIIESSLPQLHLYLFFSNHAGGKGKGVSDDAQKHLNLAGEIAQNQIDYWRSVNNYVSLANTTAMIASVSQFKIELELVEGPVIDKTLESALELLEDIESLFGTTLHDVGLSHTFSALEMKFHVGNKMGIWNVGTTAIRLLHAALVAKSNTKETMGGEAMKAHEKQVLQLWQWVQRLKARILAQSMELDEGMSGEMLISLSDNENREGAETGASVDQPGLGNQVEVEEHLRNIKLGVESGPPLHLLPKVREYLRKEEDDARNVSDLAPSHPVIGAQEPVLDLTTTAMLQEVFALHRKLRNAERVVGEPKDLKVQNQEESVGEQANRNAKSTTESGLKRLLTIANFLNQEERLLNRIKDAAIQDRFELRVTLQRLRREMRSEPVLRRMLDLREGRPLSDHDLKRIAASRGGKVAFVDWFRVSSQFELGERLHMLIWRDGVCKLIDLQTEAKKAQRDIRNFFGDPDIYLPPPERTRFGGLDLETLLSRGIVYDGEIKNVDICMELIKPLFDDSLIQPEDLLVLCTTEGIHHFPLHAVEHNGIGPLILSHPVVYTPSLSVLNKCFWTRNASVSGKGNASRYLVLGGVVSSGAAYKHGRDAVERIGKTVLGSPDTTFAGHDATLANFRSHLPGADLVHIHLHSNYTGAAFTSSPLDQALVFNDPPSGAELTTRDILKMTPSKGAHLNLMACASGRYGTLHGGIQNPITDEVMGLVPAWLFAGIGSATSTLWDIQDEHGASYSHLFFEALMRAKGGKPGPGSGTWDCASWVDLAELHRKVVLDMKRVYGQPYAWAGFVLSGFWGVRI